VCGRFAIASTPRRLGEAFEAELEEGLEERFRPSWNRSPTQEVLGVTLEPEGRRIGLFSWGLVPSWAKDRSFASRAFNARAETVATKPAFRAAFRSRRCLVPADPGFYEWSKNPSERRAPYLFLRVDGAPIALAGLWELWRPGPNAPWSRSLTIITTDAGADVAPVHSRQPVVLEADLWEPWLDPACAQLEELEAMLRPSAAGILLRRRISRAVNKATNDYPELIEEVVDPPVGRDPSASS
jgi:putative SOS response-associated peptidase YedK